MDRTNVKDCIAYGMTIKKEDAKDFINNSILWSLPGEERFTYNDGQDFDELLICLYWFKKYDSNFYRNNYSDDYSLELAETAKRAVKSFQIDNKNGAAFTSYFETAFRAEIRKARFNEISEETHHGLAFNAVDEAGNSVRKASSGRVRKSGMKNRVNWLNIYLDQYTSVSRNQMWTALGCKNPEKAKQILGQSVDELIDDINNTVVPDGENMTKDQILQALVDGNSLNGMPSLESTVEGAEDGDSFLGDFVPDEKDCFAEVENGTEPVRVIIDLCDRLYAQVRTGSRKVISYLLTGIAYCICDEEGLGDIVTKANFFSQTAYERILELEAQNLAGERSAGGKSLEYSDIAKLFAENLETDEKPKSLSDITGICERFKQDKLLPALLSLGIYI